MELQEYRSLLKSPGWARLHDMAVEQVQSSIRDMMTGISTKAKEMLMNTDGKGEPLPIVVDPQTLILEKEHNAGVNHGLHFLIDYPEGRIKQLEQELESIMDELAEVH